MSHEIERKFLVNVDVDYLIDVTTPFSENHNPLYGEHQYTQTITQHYLIDTGKWAIRVREIADVVDPIIGPITGRSFVQTMKYRISDRESIEIEESIDEKTFRFLANDRSLTTPGLIKKRHLIKYGETDLVWEVDEFINPEYMGLVLAEIELEKPDQFIRIPFWLGEEVTHLKKYRNARMARNLANLS